MQGVVGEREEGGEDEGKREEGGEGGEVEELWEVDG